MNKFRIRNLRLLVATDVAARGLDVGSLTHIINYNLPDDLEIYTHRSGRTGRAGKSGTSIVVAHLKEKNKLREIEKQINKKFSYLPVPLGKEICEKQLFHLIDRMEKVEVDTSQIETFLPKIYKKLEWLEREDLIQKFVSLEFNRFLEYYKKAPDLNVPTDSRSSRSSRDGKRKGGSGGDYEFTRFFINLGKTDDLKPQTLIGMVNDFTGIRDIEIGGIDILKNFSFFEIEEGYTDKILSSFKGQKMKKREINIEVAEKKRESGRREGGRRDGGRKSGGSFKSRGGKSSGGGSRGFSKDKPKERSGGRSGSSGRSSSGGRSSSSGEGKSRDGKSKGRGSYKKK